METSFSLEACFSLIYAMTQSALAARQMIEVVDQVREELEDVLQQFSFASETLNDLDRLFRSTSVPAPLAEDYKCRLQIFKTRLDEIEAVLHQVFENICNKAFIRKLQRKQTTIGGDIHRLTNKLLAFNQSLQSLMTAFSCQLSCSLANLVHDGISKAGPGGLGISNMRSSVDISSQYANAAPKSQNEDWSKVSELEADGSYPLANLVYDGISKAEPSGSNTSKMHSGVDISSQYVDAALKSQNEDWDKVFELDAGGARGPSYELEADGNWRPSTARLELEGDNDWRTDTTNLPLRANRSIKADTNIDRSRYRSNPASQLQSISTPTARGFQGGYRSNPASQLQPINTPTTRSFRGGPFKSSTDTSGHVLGLTLQEKYAMDAKRVQDEEWAEWAQERR